MTAELQNLRRANSRQQSSLETKSPLHQCAQHRLLESEPRQEAPFRIMLMWHGHQRSSSNAP